ncbi:MAG: hypothetical protein ACKV2V_21240 [Blastocatellia bacterium]
MNTKQNRPPDFILWLCVVLSLGAAALTGWMSLQAVPPHTSIIMILGFTSAPGFIKPAYAWGWGGVMAASVPLAALVSGWLTPLTGLRFYLYPPPAAVILIAASTAFLAAWPGVWMRNALDRYNRDGAPARKDRI